METRMRRGGKGDLRAGGQSLRETRAHKL
jgi:hypothetical protein